MWLFKAFFALLALGLLAFGGLSLYGLSLPQQHHERVTVDLPASQAQVWDLLTAYADMPKWWDQVKTVKEGQAPNGAVITWNEDEHGQRVGFVTKEQKRPKLLVREIYDPKEALGWGGTWTFRLEKLGKGKPVRTRLSVTEDGFVSNPLFRVLIAKVFGYQRQLASFTTALDAEIRRQTKAEKAQGPH